MNQETIIQKIGSELLTDGPNVSPTEIILRGENIFLASSTTVQPGDKIFVYSLTLGLAKLEEKPFIFTAEEWIEAQGYTSVRLISLLDIEQKLSALNKVSSKLSSVRQWIDSMLASYVQNPTSQSNWPTAPFSYEETIQDAFQALAS